MKVGEIFEYWKVIDDQLLRRGKNLYVKCLCIRCNRTEKYIRVLKLNSSLVSKQCSSCKNRISNYDAYSSELRYYTKVKSRAKKKKIPFQLDVKDVFSLIKKQEFKCAISGLDINFYDEKATKTASLDRKDSSKGYLKNNIQWVHKDINTMKNHFSEEYFLSLITQIYSNKKLKNGNKRVYKDNIIRWNTNYT